MILLISNEPVGRLVNFQFLLKSEKKSFPGAVALSPNHSANDGIYIIFTHVIVVPSCGTNGLSLLLNFHLVAHPVSDNVIVYVHGCSYMCHVSDERVDISHPSHRDTVYALAKY